MDRLDSSRKTSLCEIIECLEDYSVIIHNGDLETVRRSPVPWHCAFEPFVHGPIVATRRSRQMAALQSGTILAPLIGHEKCELGYAESPFWVGLYFRR
jgi:hypothetical protein